MQLFEAKPIFCVCEGSEDEHWWLTDVKKRKEEDEKKPDEDGPPSSESDAQEGAAEQKQVDALTEDSDPDSPRSDQEPLSQGGVILPVRYDSQSTHTSPRLWAGSSGGPARSI